MTDDERREVAERLRGLNDNISHVRRVYEAEGLSIICDDQADYYQICDMVTGYLPAEHMHPCDYKEVHDRLADLIEPVRDMLYVTYSRSTCGPDGRAYMVKVRHRTKGWEREFYAVDLEALLALAGYLDAMSLGGWASGPVNVGEVARRIREACGEVAE